MEDLQVANIRKIVSKLYLARLEDFYGTGAICITGQLTDEITKIFEYIDLRRFVKINVLKALQSEPVIDGGTIYNSVEQFTQVEGNLLVIELQPNLSFRVHLDKGVDVLSVVNKAVVYEWDQGTEYFYIGVEREELTQLPGYETYFVRPTFKELDQAMVQYGQNQATNSTCFILRRDLWVDPNRIILVKKPEHIMRDSLGQFLHAYLRGNNEVMREQNVNASRPIDIRVTWNYTNHVALIEIKWVGLSASNHGYEKNGATARVNEGAEQLATYLDLFATESPTKNARGYLVIYDARRHNVDTKTNSVNKEDGLRYLSEDFAFDPDYYSNRNDFERPIRFFLKPICS